MKRIYYIFLLLILLAACNPYNPVHPPTKKTVEYNLCYEEKYGQFYDSVSLNVFALDLYTDGLYLNKEGKMEGSGWNLYISDIFAAEKELNAGTYRSDSGALANTFLPGMNFEGMPHGCYLLRVDSAAVQQITVFPTGGFTLSQDQDTTDLRFWFMQKKDTVYKAHYRGVLRVKNNNSLLQ